MTKSNKLPKQSRLKYLFDYHQDGALIKLRQTSGSKNRESGTCGSQNKISKRYYLTVDGVVYPRSRVIFKWHHNEEPQEVDHINRDPSDDRIENLRAATHQQNTRNCAARGKTSAYKGVSWASRTKKWQVDFVDGNSERKRAWAETEIEAAQKYNLFVEEFGDEFHVMNDL